MGISCKKMIGKPGRLMARLDAKMKKEAATMKKSYAKKSKKNSEDEG